MLREGGGEGGTTPKRAKLNPPESIVTEINTALLEDGEDKKMAECPVCFNQLREPTLGCPEGHEACYECYLGVLSAALALPMHECSCPEAQVECPNAGCGVTVARRSMEEHRRICGREVVECSCPGCEERMARVDVGQHMDSSRAVHLQRAWKREAKEAFSAIEWQKTLITAQANSLKEQGDVIAKQQADMAAMMAGLDGDIAYHKKLIAEQASYLSQQGLVIIKQRAAIAELIATSTALQASGKAQAEEMKQQLNVNAGLHKRAEALTRVFNWSTDGSWSHKDSLPCKFTDGVRGSTFNTTLAGTVLTLNLNPKPETSNPKP